jgi:RND family efflux transporter MFP subunit
MTNRSLPRLMLACLMVGAVAACGPSDESPQQPPPAVEYREVTLEPVATVFEFVARTRAREDAQVRAQVSGTIIERAFEEGQSVEKDALLFRIDPRPYETALSSAQAQRQNARSALQVAEQNLARGLKLVDDGFISAAEMDQLRGKRDSALAAVEEARAAVEKAEIDLDFTEVRAPFAGTAGRTEVSIGDLVSPSSGPLVTLVQLDPMLVDFEVNEQALAQNLATNQQRAAQGLPPVEFTPRLKLVTGEMYDRDGVIDYADNRVNPSTGTVSVTARFPNPDGLLYPGQFARVLVQRGEPELRLLIPQQSVLEDMQGRYVFVVTEDGTVARRNVELGQREGVDWVVLAGLEEDDRVIVHGIQKVRSGMPVTATPVAVPLEGS